MNSRPAAVQPEYRALPAPQGCLASAPDGAGCPGAHSGRLAGEAAPGTPPLAIMDASCSAAEGGGGCESGDRGDGEDARGQASEQDALSRELRRVLQYCEAQARELVAARQELEHLRRAQERPCAGAADAQPVPARRSGAPDEDQECGVEPPVGDSEKIRGGGPCTEQEDRKREGEANPSTVVESAPSGELVGDAIADQMAPGMAPVHGVCAALYGGAGEDMIRGRSSVDTPHPPETLAHRLQQLPAPAELLSASDMVVRGAPSPRVPPPGDRPSLSSAAVALAAGAAVGDDRDDDPLEELCREFRLQVREMVSHASGRRGSI